MLVTKTAKRQDKEATGNAGNERHPMIFVNDAADTELFSEYGPKMTRLI